MARQMKEWVSFDDPEEERTWTFDVTFLLSRWSCLFGAGCQGVLTEPTPELQAGCCSYGAHFSGPGDEARVEAAAARLDAGVWQFRSQGRRRGILKTSPAGDRVTRMVDGACIMLNRPGFVAGTGCALHIGALAAGEAPLQWKPDVCWQLPLRREDRDGNGRVVSIIGEWDRRGWGPGGAEFAWWCTEAPEAFEGSRPVYVAMAAELISMTGPAVYETLKEYLDHRRTSGTPVGHPTLKSPIA